MLKRSFRSFQPFRTNERRSVASRATIWSGFENWRTAEVDSRRIWRDYKAENDPNCQSLPLVAKTLAECGEIVLNTADPLEKAKITHAAYRAFKWDVVFTSFATKTFQRDGRIEIGKAEAPDRPARPSKPKCVSPKDMPSMETSPLPKPVYMLHNLAHIELNAIDLAWDTLVRFSKWNLGKPFFMDFAHVADDESRHFCWCVQRMKDLGYAYGDMPAHDLLWRSAEQSRHDLSARLTLIPMCQEARGLDAGPRLAHRLFSLKDISSAKLVRRIAEEEQAHVAVGIYHFLAVLETLDESPGDVFRGWIENLAPECATGRFDHISRERVGLPRSWYDRSCWKDVGLDKTALSALKERLRVLLEFEDGCEGRIESNG